MSAAARRVSASANAVRSWSRGRCASRTHNSGPTPAGSPGTSASRIAVISAAGGGRRGRFGARGRLGGLAADVDEGLATHLAQEPVPLVFQLATADGLAHLGAAVVVAYVGLAGAQAFDDVPTGLGTDRLRNLAVLQSHDLSTEVGTVLVLGEPAQVAALALRARILGAFLGDLGEVGAAGDAGTQRIGRGLGLRVGGVVVDADQDVARM